MTISDEEFELANQRGKEATSRFSPAVDVRYDEATGNLLVTLKSGVSIVVLAAAIQGLEEANSEQLSHVEISPSGLGLHFPAIDVDVYLPGILEGSFGTKRWLEVRNTQS
jgi:hypothetical protein